MDDESDLIITYQDIAERHAVTLRTVRRWVESGELDAPRPVTKPGTSIITRRWPRSILVQSDAVATRRRER